MFSFIVCFVSGRLQSMESPAVEGRLTGSEKRRVTLVLASGILSDSPGHSPSAVFLEQSQFAESAQHDEQ
jgi:hypothetical protein